MCILLNIVGKGISERLRLPIWLDSFGTALTAFGYGPVCGAIVGIAGNIIYGLTDGISFVYSITNAAIGIVIGITAKRTRFDTVFGTMTASVLVTLAAVTVSVPLNIFFYGGMTGNLWGNGVVGFLSEQGIPYWLCCIVGEFYVDFLDKLITLFTLYAVIKLHKLRLKITDRHHSSDTAAKITVLLLCVPLAASALGIRVSAQGTEQVTTDMCIPCTAATTGCPAAKRTISCRQRTVYSG